MLACVRFRGNRNVLQLSGADNLYCSYSLMYGPDWDVVQGKAYGQTQVGVKPPIGEARQHHTVVWNCPVDISFKSPNPFGWPQIVFQIFSTDSKKDEAGAAPCLAYGVAHFPIGAGTHEAVVRLFKPTPSSHFQSAMAWLFSKPPQFKDPSILARNEGRELARTESAGTLCIKFNCVTKDMGAMGYVASDVPAAALAAMPQ